MRKYSILKHFVNDFITREKIVHLTFDMVKGDTEYYFVDKDNHSKK